MANMKPTEIAFAAVFCGAIAFAGYSYFWVPAETKEVRETRHARHAENRARFAELDRQECAIMLRAEAEMIPVEIERHTLFGGISEEDARKMVMIGFNSTKKLCEEHGIPPSATASKGDTRDDCERHPGVYGC